MPLGNRSHLPADSSKFISKSGQGKMEHKAAICFSSRGRDQLWKFWILTRAEKGDYPTLGQAALVLKVQPAPFVELETSFLRTNRRKSVVVTLHRGKLGLHVGSGCKSKKSWPK